MFEVIEVALLLDFYGSLLTGRTQEIMQLYYNEDWSLAEIADRLQVSRQSVHNAIKRGHRHLSEYEDRLHLLAKQRQRHTLLNQLKEALLKNKVPDEQKKFSILAALAAVDDIVLSGGRSAASPSEQENYYK